jgi:hypothetical protein
VLQVVEILAVTEGAGATRLRNGVEKSVSTAPWPW